ncbi:hypothetical protein CORC01_07276 [Colletotrichum orchidophilum]|uniref:Uncharacterized protein n=1 Tax=Colletotrichum orchidophilum TaxID=1209926 RepID=A0A1G4B7X9_9PEZI|nr:uncharacterized protein CORC01_07276 [Colletotrichum orchidophilum]OHE97494.1 hypothetical protein CORC01_07276 [Colletotrichum orchidophilum]
MKFFNGSRRPKMIVWIKGSLMTSKGLDCLCHCWFQASRTCMIVRAEVTANHEELVGSPSWAGIFSRWSSVNSLIFLVDVSLILHKIMVDRGQAGTWVYSSVRPHPPWSLRKSWPGRCRDGMMLSCGVDWARRGKPTSKSPVTPSSKAGLSNRREGGKIVSLYIRACDGQSLRRADC